MSKLSKNLVLVWILIVFIPAAALPSDLPAESHPSILYDNAMVPTILDRVARTPYSDWWAQVQAIADDGLNFNFSNPAATEFQKSRYAKALAFAYLITNENDYADACLDALENINPAGDWGADYYAHADPMMWYCEAYDMLKGTGYDLGASDPTIRGLITTKAQEFSDNFFINFYINNWRVRYHSALGIAAMTLADADSAEAWHDQAESSVTTVFTDFQVQGEGAWAEGPYYLLYSAKIYLPYMLAFNRLISGADLINMPEVAATQDWSWKIRMPSGQRPNFEDSHLTYFHNDLVAAVYNDGVYNWDFETVIEELYADDVDAVDNICYYDDSITPTAPDINPTIYMPEAGNMIFRSGWGFDDIYLFLIGEHDEALDYGLGHDHPDATSFMLYAYGEYLGLDAGYIEWEQRTAVHKARNHSMILVDGEGPPASTSTSAGDADAYLEDFYNLGDYKFCRANTLYQGVNFDRGVLFVDELFFVIYDEVLDDFTHTYNWRFHGNGGETSGGTLSLNSNGATYERDSATLYVYTDATEPLTFSTTVDTHSFNYNEILTHSALDAECSGDTMMFLSVFYPVDEGASQPQVEMLDAGEQLAYKFEGGIAAASIAETDYTLPNSLTGYPEIVADCKFMCLGIGASNVLEKHALHGATTFRYNGTQLFSADAPVILALDRTGQNWNGYASGYLDYTISIYSEYVPNSVTYNGSPATYTYSDYMIEISLSGSGALEIKLSSTHAFNDRNNAEVKSFSLHNARPNPFNQSTVLSFELLNACPVKLAVYDIAGRKVATIAEENMPAGKHSRVFDGSDLASGIYFAKLETAGEKQALKMLLIK